MSDCRHGAARSLFLGPGIVRVTTLIAEDDKAQRIGGLCVEHAKALALDSGEGWMVMQKLNRPETIALFPPLPPSEGL